MVVPIYEGTPNSKAKNLRVVARFLKDNAEKIKAAGRQTVIFDSLTDYNGFLVEAETPDDGSKIEFDSWQRIQVNTLRPVEDLKHVTNAGLDLILIVGIKPTDAASGGHIVNGGNRPLIAGGARDTFLFKLMAACTLQTKVTRDKGEMKVERKAFFLGSPGQLVAKQKGSLAIEEVDFQSWKSKAFSS